MARPLDAETFTSAFVQHGRALWLVAAGWVGRGDADDLLQEAARVGWQRRQQFVPGSDFRAWLAQIIRNTGANWRRQRRPEAVATLPELAARPEAVEVSPMQLGDDELSDELQQALAGLPPAARACLLLHAVGGHGFAEIATMLDLPENTAMSHARRARLALRQALERDRARPERVPERP